MVCDEPAENELPSASIPPPAPMPDSPVVKSAAARTALYLHGAPSSRPVPLSAEPQMPFITRPFPIPDYVAEQKEPFPSPPQTVEASLLPPEQTSVLRETSIKVLRYALSALSISHEAGTSVVSEVSNFEADVLSEHDRQGAKELVRKALALVKHPSTAIPPGTLLQDAHYRGIFAALVLYPVPLAIPQNGT